MKIIIVTIFVLFIYKNAYSYVDPGAGAVLLQIILGGLGGIILLIKLKWKTISQKFHKKKGREQIEDTTKNDDVK